MYRAGFYDHTESGFAIKAVANASGVAVGFLGPVPPGYCWYVGRYTSKCPTAATVTEIAVLSTPLAVGDVAAWDRAGRQDWSAAAANNAADNNTPVYVGEGYFLVAVFTAATSADVCVLSTQIDVHKLALDSYGSGVEDSIQIGAYSQGQAQIQHDYEQAIEDGAFRGI